jgi:hypothetical protein
MNGGKMKIILLFACMCLLLIGTANPAIADLAGIQILSEQYHVLGGYDITIPEGFPPYSGHYTDSYNLDSTNSSGISGSVNSPVGNAGAQSSAGRFFAGANSDEDIGYAWAFASASVSFQTVESGWLHADIYGGDI